jgi:hypothetical protein
LDWRVKALALRKRLTAIWSRTAYADYLINPDHDSGTFAGVHAAPVAMTGVELREAQQVITDGCRPAQIDG